MNAQTNRPRHWMYYPDDVRPPDWVNDLLDSLAPSLAPDLTAPRLSARVRERSRASLERLAYRVADGYDLIRLPLRYQFEGRPGPYGSLQLVAFRSEMGIAVQIESGARAADIAVRHLIEASLCREVRNLVILIPIAISISPSPATAVLVALGASMGVPFVISTPPNAMVYGEGGLRPR